MMKEEEIPMQGAEFLASKARLPRKYFSTEGITDPESVRKTYGYNEFVAEKEGLCMKLLSAYTGRCEAGSVSQGAGARGPCRDWTRRQSSSRSQNNRGNFLPPTSNLTDTSFISPNNNLGNEVTPCQRARRSSVRCLRYQITTHPIDSTPSPHPLGPRPGKGVVVGTGYNTQFGEIFALMESEETPKTPLQKNMDKLGKHLSLISFVVIALILVVGFAKGQPIQDMLTIGVRMSKKKAIVRKLPSVETLGCVNVVCVDKTGTLTKNEMTVTIVTTASGNQYEITGTGYFEGGHISLRGSALSQCPEDLAVLGKIALLCNNSTITDTEMLGNPTDGALLTMARKLSINLDPHTRLEEIPFTHDRKYMAVKCASSALNDNGVFYAKGATERVLGLCCHVLDNGQLRKMTAADRDRVIMETARKEDTGMRTISLCYGSSLTSGSLVYVGHVGIVDPIRNEVPATISMLHANYVSVKMITGDSQNIAISIGKQLGIHQSDSTALSGDAIDSMTDDELARRIENVSIVYRSTPKHKMRVIKVRIHRTTQFLLHHAIENSERVLGLCCHVLDNGQLRKMTAADRDRVIMETARKEDTGMRTISLCYGSSLTSGSLVYVGHVGIVDPIRNEVPATISMLHANYVSVKMITGDSQNIAISIGKQLGIHQSDSTALSGDAIDSMTDDELARRIENVSIVYRSTPKHKMRVIKVRIHRTTQFLLHHAIENSGDAIDSMTDDELARRIENVSIVYRSTPKHKMRVIKALQARSLIVAMTGDGVNDAVALKCADIGVAMGKGTDVCKEAAEMVLANDDMSAILEAHVSEIILELFILSYGARKAVSSDSKLYHVTESAYITTHTHRSVSALSMIALTTFWNIPPPLNPMQILWINIIMDGPPAQSLGVEPITSASSCSPPRSPKKQVIDRVMLFRVCLSAFIIVSGTLWVYKNENYGGEIPAFGVCEYCNQTSTTTPPHSTTPLQMVDGQVTARDTTMTFACFIFFDMWNALSCRSLVSLSCTIDTSISITTRPERGQSCHVLFRVQTKLLNIKY
eukprot:sb/3461514/